MTRKDYQQIAQCINEMICNEVLTETDGIVAAEYMARDLEHTNPRFQKNKFLNAAVACIEWKTY